MRTLPWTTRVARTIAAGLFSFFPLAAAGQTPDSTAARRFRFEAYAAINYAHYDWDTEAHRRAVVDLERLVLEGEYAPTPRLSFEAELELEHGGTGSSIVSEAVGEFQTELEKGGEVVIEELHATFALKRWLDLRVGHFYVPVGFLSSKYKPFEYPTVLRPEMETALLPAQWDETGLKVMAHRRWWRAQLGVVNGLDNSEFTAATWIRGGKQRRFEQVRAENLAGFARLDVLPVPGLVTGISGYAGNTSGNRPHNDLALPAYVKVVEAHADYERGGWRVRAMGLRGWLQNSAEVSAANRLVDADRAPVAAQAAGVSIEAGYDVLRLLRTPIAENPAGLDLFGRWEWYDSMHRVASGEVDDPRYERRQWIIGFNYRINHNLVLKGEYADRSLRLPSSNHERTFATGLGAQF